MGFIDKYLIPKQVDFVRTLGEQTAVAGEMMEALLEACAADDHNRLERVDELGNAARELKSRNMERLLDVFITPYDKESIYRMITQLDWIALSVKHFKLEATVYPDASLVSYSPAVETLRGMVQLLEEGLDMLASHDLRQIAASNRQIHESYDHVVTLCSRASAEIADRELREVLSRRDLFRQLREIAKRIHITANTLEDMAIKVS
ncbi:MAG: hypothetical protein DRJ42_18050 [Deltaproteobacteria bacterium]|nr:MAG: hypothetical protein DRJ42_18050 [Deltaproteobacteria bacterium]